MQSEEGSKDNVPSTSPGSAQPAYQVGTQGKLQTSVCHMPGRWNVLSQPAVCTPVAEEITAFWATNVIR